MVNLRLSMDAKRGALWLGRHFGWLAMLAALAAAAGDPNVGGVACLTALFWGAALMVPAVSNTMKLWAVGTRAPRSDLFETKLLAIQSKSFRRLAPIEQAMAARENLQIQRRIWWDAAAVMWMRANPGCEHLWAGMLAAPKWFDDAKAWRDETAIKLEEAADRGWICPNSRVASLLCHPEKQESKVELGTDIEGFAKLGDPWPAQARYCDTLASMGHKLFGEGFAESLAWRSHGALERIKICSDMESLGGARLPSGRRLRL